MIHEHLHNTICILVVLRRKVDMPIYYIATDY